MTMSERKWRHALHVKVGAEVLRCAFERHDLGREEVLSDPAQNPPGCEHLRECKRDKNGFIEECDPMCNALWFARGRAQGWYDFADRILLYVELWKEKQDLIPRLADLAVNMSRVADRTGNRWWRKQW